MAAAGEGAPVELDLIQRVILPSEHDPDIVPLYVDADYWTSIPVAPEKRRRSPLRVVDSDTHNAVVRLSDMGIISAIKGDRGFQVPHRRKVSFGTYFNAFPASYWRASTTLDGVVLEVETSGEGQVIVYRSNARGVIQKVDGAAVSGSATSRFEPPVHVLRRRRLVLVRPDGGGGRLRARRGRLVRPRGLGPHHGSRRVGEHRHHDAQPGRVLREAPHRHRREARRRGAPRPRLRHRPGHAEGRGPARVPACAGASSARSCASSTRPTSADPAGSPAACTRRSRRVRATTSSSWTTTSRSSRRASAAR
ncbi:hypothetical protein [Clavibacter tessellarius]|uniref:hypothetical protein n=1 Tax=Clavibacter tessellarius TaxID=31965 RepID=UPI00324523DA